MPTVFQAGPYRFFFFSEEGNEPPHLHIEAAERRCKYWMRTREFAWNDGFRSGELKEIERLIAENVDLILGKWNDFFAD
jgi:hypothetical protein